MTVPCNVLHKMKRSFHGIWCRSYGIPVSILHVYGGNCFYANYGLVYRNWREELVRCWERCMVRVLIGMKSDENSFCINHFSIV